MRIKINKSGQLDTKQLKNKKMNAMFQFELNWIPNYQILLHYSDDPVTAESSKAHPQIISKDAESKPQIL